MLADCNYVYWGMKISAYIRGDFKSLIHLSLEKNLNDLQQKPFNTAKWNFNQFTLVFFFFSPILYFGLSLKFDKTKTATVPNRSLMVLPVLLKQKKKKKKSRSYLMISQCWAHAWRITPKAYWIWSCLSNLSNNFKMFFLKVMCVIFYLKYNH